MNDPQPSELALAVARYLHGIRMSGRKEWAIELWSTEIQRAMNSTVKDIQAARDEWRQCAINYAKGQPTDRDYVVVGLAFINDSIEKKP